MSKDSIRIFCSYSHKDEALKNELKGHLAILLRLKFIEVWDDRAITPGEYWKSEIKENLENADIILFLVSFDFIASDYCFDIEVTRALELHKEGKAIVVPIILRECLWEDAPFAHVQGLPTDMKPIVSQYWYTKDEAYKNVTLNLRKLINELIKGKEDREKKDFEALSDSIAEYRDFITRYNDGELVQRAKVKLLELDEGKYWEEKNRLNNIQSFEEYIAQYPAGKYVQTAKQKINDLAEQIKRKKGSIDNLEEVELIYPEKARVAIKSILGTMLHAKNNPHLGNGSSHFLFFGAPGTGKTSTAIILSQLLKSLGHLSKGHVTNVSRMDLVGQYLGQTTNKVQEIVQHAMGGVLFIDEAYNLGMDSDDTFGKEAMNALIYSMANFRSDICFIFTGYKKEMKKFLELNPGLNSRIDYHINFDLNDDDLVEFLKLRLTQESISFDNRFIDGCMQIIKIQRNFQETAFGNYRFIQLLLRETILNFIQRCETYSLDRVKELIRIEDVSERFNTDDF